jgi:hypothetical protein
VKISLAVEYRLLELKKAKYANFLFKKDNTFGMIQDIISLNAYVNAIGIA